MRKRIYVSSSSTIGGTARSFAAQLIVEGYDITSTWYDREVVGYDDPNFAEVGKDFAITDLDELRRADIVLAITEAQSSGGMHAEIGMALALGKELIVVGPRRGVFTYHPDCHVVKTLEEALTIIG